MSRPLLISTAVLLSTLLVGLAHGRAAADVALIALPQGFSIPTPDSWLATPEDEPVAVDARLGWTLQEFHTSQLDGGAEFEVTLTLADDDSDEVEPIPGEVVEERFGDGQGVLWFFPAEPLAPETAYLFTMVDGNGSESLSDFTTGAAELASVEADLDLDGSLTATWTNRPYENPWLQVSLTTSLDDGAAGSARTSVIRVSEVDEDGDATLKQINVVGIDRSALAFWSETFDIATPKPGQVCVVVVHENGRGELSDEVEICTDVQRSSGCSVSGGADSRLALLLVAAAAILRRRAA